MCGEALKSKNTFQEGPHIRYTPKLLRGMPNSLIRSMGRHPEKYVRQLGRVFTRPRTLTFEEEAETAVRSAGGTVPPLHSSSAASGIRLGPSPMEPFCLTSWSLTSSSSSPAAAGGARNRRHLLYEASSLNLESVFYPAKCLFWSFPQFNKEHKRSFTISIL